MLDGTTGFGEQNAKELIQDQKRTSIDVSPAMPDASTSSQLHQYEKDAKNFRSDSVTVPPSFYQGVLLAAGNNDNKNDNVDANAMAVEPNPRLGQNDDDAGGVASSSADDELSLDLSMPRLVRAPQRTATTPVNSELLQPSQRLIKVQPEAGCPQPGAYAARQSRTFANDRADSDNHTYSIPEDSQNLASSNTLDLPLTSSNDDLFPREPSLQAATTSVTFTMAPLGGDYEPSTHMRHSSSLHVDESFGSESPGYMKPNRRRWCFIGAGIAALALVVGIGTGIGLAMSGNKPESSPQPPSCSLETIFDECFESELPSFQSEIPSCVVDQYETLRKTYTSKFRLSAPEEKSCSPENLALLSSALHTTQSTSDTTISNRFGLTVLYFATGSSNTIKSEGWTSEIPHCEWGSRLGQIECNGTGDPDHVTGIELVSCGLHGYLPSNLPLFLPYLETLDVHDNALTGTLPADFASLSNLSVRKNLLTGSISSAFTKSQTLIEFIVGDNLNLTLSRDQPFFSGTQLRSLDLNGVNFYTGTVPTELWLLTNLVGLSFRDMELNGTFPSELFELTKLQVLVMPGNRLTGTLPTGFGAMLNLEELELSSNSFNGTIPSEVGELPRILELLLDYNSLVGTMPSELGRLTQLRVLSVYSNELTGQMPMEISRLTSVQSLLFGENNLSGTIPEDVCALKSQGTMIEFGSEYDGLALDVGGLSCPDSMPECCNPIPL